MVPFVYVDEICPSFYIAKRLVVNRASPWHLALLFIYTFEIVQPTKSELRLAMRKFPEAHEALNTGVQEKWDPANILAWQGQSQQ